MILHFLYAYMFRYRLPSLVNAVVSFMLCRFAAQKYGLDAIVRVHGPAIRCGDVRDLNFCFVDITFPRWVANKNYNTIRAACTAGEFY